MTYQLWQPTDTRKIEASLANWPRTSRHIAEKLLKRYDVPQEVSDYMWRWHYNSPWVRTTVYREGVRHNFPRRHEDVVQQSVYYRLPLEKYRQLVEFNGSLMIDRTRGLITSWCESEEMNVVNLNLAHDIVVGKRTVQEARQTAFKMTRYLRVGWPEPYAQRLWFTNDMMAADMDKSTLDPDKTPIFKAR